MNIAIIGSGNVGTALGSSLARAGHRVIYAARREEHAHQAAGDTGGVGAPGPAAAARESDVIMLAVPFATAAQDVAAQLAPVVADKIVIDATNPLSADGSSLDALGGHSGAEQIAVWLPGARVVKAFNTLFASLQADPDAHGTTIDALYATDDQEARKTVADLIESIGFRPVFVGPLARARELEALAFLNIRLQIEGQGDWRTAITLVGPPQAAVEH